MKQIIIATKNKHKLEEYAQMLNEYELISLNEIDPNIDIIEDGQSFKDNALIKARALYKRLSCMVIADDSGLCIDYLNGEPGIYSARYMGEDTSYDIKNKAIIDRMKDAKDDERGAKFICAIACILDDGREIVVQGEFIGSIAYEIKGNNGFGYDPIFYLKEYACTAAQLSSEMKNRISHRANALKLLEEALKNEGTYC